MPINSRSNPAMALKSIKLSTPITTFLLTTCNLHLLQPFKPKSTSSSSSTPSNNNTMNLFESDNLNACTELRLGLPGTSEDNPKPSRPNKRDFTATSGDDVEDCTDTAPPPPKAQIVGWPPVRSYRKNIVQKKSESESPATYVKVSMDGAPYLRKIDLKIYMSYQELIKALEEMFKFKIGDYSEKKGLEYAPTYEDKDGDWMLVGDVPWNMFISSCKRMRIMKGAEARGLTCN